MYGKALHGDACWAQKYDLISEAMPNMTTILFRQNSGTDKAKLVGSALLIETTNEDGTEPALVLRGLNPIESYINKVNIAGFYDEVASYVKEIAKRLGRVPAIVIDDHSGGSGTNRPALFDYMVEQIHKLSQYLVAKRGTVFNGYDITDYTYRLT